MTIKRITKEEVLGLVIKGMLKLKYIPASNIQVYSVTLFINVTELKM